MFSFRYILTLNSIKMYNLCINYLFLFVLVCDKAEPATVLAESLNRLSFNILEAVDATFFDVCFLFTYVSPPS